MNVKYKNSKPNFVEWLFHGKGTVREPWSTARYILNKPINKESREKIENFVKKQKLIKNNIK